MQPRQAPVWMGLVSIEFLQLPIRHMCWQWLRLAVRAAKWPKYERHCVGWIQSYELTSVLRALKQEESATPALSRHWGNNPSFCCVAMQE
jgi:hypothetical protein